MAKHTDSTATTSPTIDGEPGALEEVRASVSESDELAGRIRDLGPLLKDVANAITELIEQKNELVVRAYSDGDVAARTELDALNTKILLEERRKVDIETARQQLEAELKMARQREKAAELGRLEDQADELWEKNERRRAECVAAAEVLAECAVAYSDGIKDAWLLKRSIQQLSGNTYDLPNSEEMTNQLRSLAEKIALRLQGAGLPVGRSDEEFVMGVVVGRRNATAELQAAGAGPARPPASI